MNETLRMEVRKQANFKFVKGQLAKIIKFIIMMQQLSLLVFHYIHLSLIH